MQVSVPDEKKEQQRYTDKEAILKSERIYGKGFQSPGGTKHIGWLCKRAGLKKGLKILDVGCGLGGGSIFLANEYDAEVLGIDVAELMVEMSKERGEEMLKSGSADFRVGTEFSEFLEPGSFDAIFSVDCFVYVEDKVKSFKRIRELLKADGIFCLSDFSCGEETEEFKEYQRVAKYYLPKVDAYPEIVSEAGMTVQFSENISDMTRKFLEEDLNSLISRNEKTPERLEDMKFHIDRWRNKIRMNASNLLQQMFIVAKP